MAQYNLVGYFRGETEDGCTLFSIRFIPTFGDHLPWREVELAGENPVVVQYTSNSNPFIPIMESRCSITAVANEYFMDLYGPDIQHCQVVLRNEDTQEFEWVGYLTNNLMNMPMDGCMETFTFEAIDCLSTLEYFDYAPLSGKKQIVTFQDILADMASNCMLIQKLVVDSSMKNENGQVIHMDELQISEQNFFSSDTDEPWSKKEVLEEICRFCGYTAFQWKDTIYLYDKQAHTGYEWNIPTDSNLYFSAQISSGDFHTYINSGDYIRCCNVTEDNIRGTGADISLQTIYNKVTVLDSFYEIGDFIPDLYNDDELENVLGESWMSEEQLHVRDIQNVLLHNFPGSSAIFDGNEKPVYIDKRGTNNWDADNGEKQFFQRRFTHKWYSTVYRAPHSLAVITPQDTEWDLITMVPTKDNNNHIIGFAIMIRVYNCTEEDASITVQIGCEGYTNSQTKTIEANSHQDYILSISQPGHTFTELPTMTVGSYGPYAILDKSHVTKTRGYIGGHIVDLATVQKANPSQYNFTPTSKLDFTRYIMINQMDEPDNLFCNPRYSGYSAQQLNYYYPPVLSLNSGWTKPIIINDQCYLTINGSAIFERYKSMDYINPDWTKECTGYKKAYNINYWSLWDGDGYVYTTLPALMFKLKIGNYYWNGTGWTTTNTPFYVDLHTPTDEDGYVDFEDWWNDSHDIINNVSWTDFTNVEGYKIPLTGVTFDFNADIEFSICLPSKIQVYGGDLSHDGMNNYCYIKDLKLEFDTKGSENYDLTDIVYENVIDEFSVNTLDDITLKITTYPGEGQHSYSNVGYNGQLIDLVKKDGLDDVANKMEENIIKAYVNQLNTNTIEETMVLDRTATPLSRVKDTDNGKFFHVCGLEIDYARARQRVNLIESKKWNQVEE